MEGVDCGGLDQSRHDRQLMLSGTPTDDDETTPMNELVEKPMDKQAAKPVTKTEQNIVIPATPCTIIQIHAWWRKVAQGSNVNKSEFTEVGRKGQPLNQLIQGEEMTKVPGQQHSGEADR
jgi:hypothetical protein